MAASISDLNNLSLKTTILNIFKRVKSVENLKKQLTDIYKQEKVIEKKPDEKKFSKKVTKGDTEIIQAGKVKLELKKKQSKGKNEVVVSILRWGTTTIFVYHHFIKL